MFVDISKVGNRLLVSCAMCTSSLVVAERMHLFLSNENCSFFILLRLIVDYVESVKLWFYVI